MQAVKNPRTVHRQMTMSTRARNMSFRANHKKYFETSWNVFSVLICRPFNFPKKNPELFPLCRTGLDDVYTYYTSLNFSANCSIKITHQPHYPISRISGYFRKGLIESHLQDFYDCASKIMAHQLQYGYGILVYRGQKEGIICAFSPNYLA
jgi:hypothetical protein